MNPTAQQHLDTLVTYYRDSGPEGWLRLVAWFGFLADDDGTVDRSGWIHPQVAVVAGPDGALTQVDFAENPQAIASFMGLDAALSGEPEEGWTVLRLVIDRDDVRADFSHEPARPWADSATDPFWDDVHQYLDRNREELDALAARSGGTSGTDDAPKKRGRLFGRG